MNTPEQKIETRGRKKLPVELKRMTASFCLDRGLYEKIEDAATRLNCSKSQVISEILTHAFKVRP